MVNGSTSTWVMFDVTLLWLVCRSTSISSWNLLLTTLLRSFACFHEMSCLLMNNLHDIASYCIIIHEKNDPKKPPEICKSWHHGSIYQGTFSMHVASLRNVFKALRPCVVTNSAALTSSDALRLARCCFACAKDSAVRCVKDSKPQKPKAGGDP